RASRCRGGRSAARLSPTVLTPLDRLTRRRRDSPAMRDGPSRSPGDPDRHQLSGWSHRKGAFGDQDLETHTCPHAFVATSRFSGCCTGKVKEKVLPLPTSLSTQSCPRCISTRLFAIASPSPVPVVFCLPSVAIW